MISSTYWPGDDFSDQNYQMASGIVRIRKEKKGTKILFYVACFLYYTCTHA